MAAAAEEALDIEDHTGKCVGWGNIGRVCRLTSDNPLYRRRNKRRGQTTQLNMA